MSVSEVISDSIASPILRDPPSPTNRPAPPRPIFTADAAAGSDALGHDSALRPIAELAAHAGAQTPLTIGLFGGPGSGKSVAATRFIARVQTLAAAAKKTPSPFLPDILAVRVSAPDIKGEPSAAIAGALHAALVAPGASFSGLADEAARASTDPSVAAREANDRLDEARRRLEDERRILEDHDGRRARLPETVLYEAGGTRIDAYARANRSRFDSRLRAFGFAGDPVATYKDLVRDVAGHNGIFDRLSLCLRSLWSFQGQARLIVWAVVLLLLAQGCAIAINTSDSWLPALRGSAESANSAADWIDAHLWLLGSFRQIAIVVACVLLATNVWRAIRFLMPLMRGASLLSDDIDSRRRGLDAALAHQTRRVDAISSDVDARARDAAEAERRVAEGARTGAPAARNPFADDADAPGRLARGFVATLERAMAAGAGKNVNAPRRILVIIDDLEATTHARALEIVETAHRLLSHPGFVTLVVADPARLSSTWSSAAEASARFERLFQAPVSLSDRNGDPAALATYVRGLLGDAPVTSDGETPDASRSVLNDPMRREDAALLATLAPLAGRTPRAAKRFVNTFRIARGRGADPAALALMLALDIGGELSELAAMGAAMDIHTPNAALVINDPGELRLALALKAANEARGKPLTIADAQKAWAIVRDYRMPL